jgi:hypothetical protein
MITGYNQNYVFSGIELNLHFGPFMLNVGWELVAYIYVVKGNTNYIERRGKIEYT